MRYTDIFESDDNFDTDDIDLNDKSSSKDIDLDECGDEGGYGSSYLGYREDDDSGYECCEDDDDDDYGFDLDDDGDVIDYDDRDPNPSDIDDFDMFANDEDDEEELSPDEERKADDMMNVLGTEQIVKHAMDTEDVNDINESAEQIRVLCNEGFITESTAELMLSSDYYTEKSFSTPRKVKFTKDSVMKQLYWVAVYSCARAKNDKDMKKLTIINEKRRSLKQKISKKYNGPAKQRMKIYFKRLQKSKSNPIKKAANEVIKRG